MSRTNLERETVIVFNDAEDVATLWTASPVTRRRWERLRLAVTERGGGWKTAVPKRCVRIRNPHMKRVLSEKHKAALLGHRPSGRRGENANN